jgi:hypothetical protein
MSIETEEKVECSKYSCNSRHYGCLRAWIKGGPANCIDFKKREAEKLSITCNTTSRPASSSRQTINYQGRN